jgi:hypothetical protein
VLALGSFRGLFHAEKVTERTTLSINVNGPDDRRRLDGTQFIARDQQIWRMRSAGHTVREIAETVGCGVATVDRALKRLVHAPWADGEFEADLDVALARYDDDGLRHEEVESVEDIIRLNALEYFRLRNLPLDDPRRELWGAALASGWQHPSTVH